MRASYRVVRTEPVWCNHAIDEWRRRLSACVDAEGRHFEHYLWLLYSQKQCQNGNTINLTIGDDFLFSFAMNVNEQRIIAPLTGVLLFKFTK